MLNEHLNTETDIVNALRQAFKDVLLNPKFVNLLAAKIANSLDNKNIKNISTKDLHEQH